MRKTATFYELYFFESAGKQRRKGAKFWFVLILSLALVLAIVLFAVFKKSTNRDKFSKKAFLVVVGKYDFVSDAKDMADNVEVAGGAGFIWVDDSFWVVAFAYPTKEMAENIEKQLSGSKWRCEIEEIKLKKPKKSRLSNSQWRAVEGLWDCMNNLFEIALALDRKEISAANAYKQISKQRKDIAFLEKKMGDDELDRVFAERLEAVKGEIDEFLKSSFPNNLYSSGIKSICVKCVYLCSGLWSEVEKLQK